MGAVEEAGDEAERIFRSVRRSERLWPAALIAAALYLASSTWSFTRELGDTGLDATVQALPTIWVPLGILGIVVAAHLLAHLAEQAGSSPFWAPRQARRVLVALAVVLPVLMFAVEPALAILSVDRGSVDPMTLGEWLVTVRITPNG